MSHIDTSNELLLLPHLNGAKLIKPDDEITHYQSLNRSLFSIRQLLGVPFNFYLYNQCSEFEISNEANALTCGFDSPTHAIRKKLHIGLQKDTADRLEKTNINVMKNKNPIFIEESMHTLHNHYFGSNSFKFPLYDKNNRISGLFGLSAVIERNQNMIDLINLLLAIGLLKTCALYEDTKSITIKKTSTGYLSPRELQCLRFLSRGKTMKMIANTLGISPRTVESYIENIKSKLGVNTKSELIEKFITLYQSMID